MHEILAATKQQLTTRAAELESLIASCEQDCEAIADDGNRRIAEIRAEAEAKIDAIRAEIAKHAEELTGVRHSAATVEQIAAAAAPGDAEAKTDG